MKQQQLRLRIQAYCRDLSLAVVSKPADQIRNRLAYLNANAELLCELLEEEK